MKEIRVCPMCFERFVCEENESGGKMCNECVEEFVDQENEKLDEIEGDIKD